LIQQGRDDRRPILLVSWLPFIDLALIVLDGEEEFLACQKT